MNNKQKGDKYEQIAEKYLENSGYSVIERNYRNRIGEIDIIARENEYLCFVEVKYRGTSDCGKAVEAVNYIKQHKITRTALYYMQVHGYNEWTPCRFDVLAIDGEKIKLYKNAFEAAF